MFILRHGEAGTRLDDPERDDARPLTSEGRREVGVIADSMSRLGIELDLIASSPLPRALQTAEIVARRYKMLNKLEQWAELRPVGETEDLFGRLARQKKMSSVMLVGHEPRLSAIVGEIVAGNQSMNLVLKKAGLARIDVTGFKPKINGELRWLLTPRIIKKAGR